MKYILGGYFCGVATMITVTLPHNGYWIPTILASLGMLGLHGSYRRA